MTLRKRMEVTLDDIARELTHLIRDGSFSRLTSVA